MCNICQYEKFINFIVINVNNLSVFAYMCLHICNLFVVYLTFVNTF